MGSGQSLRGVDLGLNGDAGFGHDGKPVVQSGGDTALFGEGWKQDLQRLDFFASDVAQSDCAMCPSDHFLQLLVDGKNRPIWIEAAPVQVYAENVLIQNSTPAVPD